MGQVMLEMACRVDPHPRESICKKKAHAGQFVGCLVRKLRAGFASTLGITGIQRVSAESHLPQSTITEL